MQSIRRIERHFQAALSQSQSGGDVLFPSLTENVFYSSCHRSTWTSVDLWNSIHPATPTRGARVPRGTTPCSPPTQCLTNLVSPSTSTWMAVWKHEKRNQELARTSSYICKAKAFPQDLLLVHRKYGRKKKEGKGKNKPKPIWRKAVRTYIKDSHHLRLSDVPKKGECLWAVSRYPLLSIFWLPVNCNRLCLYNGPVGLEANSGSAFLVYFVIFGENICWHTLTEHKCSI